MKTSSKHDILWIGSLILLSLAILYIPQLDLGFQTFSVGEQKTDINRTGPVVLIFLLLNLILFSFRELRHKFSRPFQLYLLLGLNTITLIYLGLLTYGLFFGTIIAAGIDLFLNQDNRVYSSETVDWTLKWVTNIGLIGIMALFGFEVYLIFKLKRNKKLLPT